MREYYRNYDELPLMLTVKQVAVALGISEAKAYELANSKDFPSFRVGNRICIPKDKFIAWIQKQVK